MGIIEGDVVPQRFIPQMIALWQQGRFPFDRLIRKFPLSQIDEAERASLAGEVVKPVLLPGGWHSPAMQSLPSAQSAFEEQAK